MPGELLLYPIAVRECGKYLSLANAGKNGAQDYPLSDETQTALILRRVEEVRRNRRMVQNRVKDNRCNFVTESKLNNQLRGEKWVRTPSPFCMGWRLTRFREHDPLGGRR